MEAFFLRNGGKGGLIEGERLISCALFHSISRGSQKHWDWPHKFAAHLSACFSPVQKLGSKFLCGRVHVPHGWSFQRRIRRLKQRQNGRIKSWNEIWTEKAWIYRASALPWRNKRRVGPAAENKKNNNNILGSNDDGLDCPLKGLPVATAPGSSSSYGSGDFVSPSDAPASHRSAADDYLDGCWHLYKAAQCVCCVCVCVPEDNQS